jgi:Holliday junction resolvase RusA-like endonuclease
MPSITFEIIGLPTPQGSKTKMPNGAMLDGGKTRDARQRHKDWRTTVAQTARDVARTTDGTPLDGPLYLAVTFRFPMPASRPKALRAAGEGWKTSSPDLDKLIRALGDGLQAGGLIRDDARFVTIEASKVEVDSWTGAYVWIETIDRGPRADGALQ